MVSTLQIQTALKAKGFDPGALDGIMGPKTEAALATFKASIGFRARPFVGPLTLKALGLAALGLPEIPWVNELGRFIGYHEVRNKTALSQWLRSDGGTLGDPEKLPWCGDAIHTALRLTLPSEPYPGALGVNPYWARNWLELGVKVDPTYGAICVFSRPGGGGHVGVAVGYDPKRKRIRVRGGNQSNTVSDTWLDESRLLGYRWPSTYTGSKLPLPSMDSSGAVISRNEA